MPRVLDYQLFLFDFDGLLVNTEEIHYLAYKKMLEDNGFSFPWNFERYCQAAHYHPDALRLQIYEELPALKEKEPNWQVLYSQKREWMVKLVKNGAVELMPGAGKLLNTLAKANLKRCVVTHSPDELVMAIRNQNPVLNTIPYWITREDYTHPKPDPECYLKAIDRYAEKDDQIIAFEDTPRGIWALLKTRAKPILICKVNYPEIEGFKEKGVEHFESLSNALP
jgi:beta-phosphoglucomutase